jgi:hypothetical protein
VTEARLEGDDDPPLNPVPFDPRISVFIPDRSVSDRHILDVSPRKMRLIGAKIYDSTTQTFTTAVEADKEFDTAAFDTAGMFNNTGDVLTIPYPGIWLVTIYAEFAASAAGRRLARIKLNGSGALTTNVAAPSAGGGNLTLTTTMLLTAGDTLGMSCLQNSGGNLDTNSGESNNFLSAVLLGSI